MTAPGFTKAQVKGVEVTLNKIATTNVKLDVGTNVETVEVTAAAAAIDTTTASVQTSFETTSLADLPTASGGSGVINLSLLNAGVGSSGAVGLGTGPSVGGQRPRNNNFTIEGIDNNSGSVTGPLVIGAQRRGGANSRCNRTRSRRNSATLRAASSTRW